MRTPNKKVTKQLSSDFGYNDGGLVAAWKRLDWPQDNVPRMNDGVAGFSKAVNGVQHKQLKK